MANRNTQIEINENYFIGKKTKDFFGKAPESGDSIPLPPKSYDCPDVSHVIKEVFQEYLKDDLPSYETAKNMQLTCKENERLKKYADTIVTMYENHDDKLQDIASAEDVMMKDKARYIVKEDKLQEDNLIANIAAMKARPIFRPIDETVLKKFPLIAAKDVFRDDFRDKFDFQSHEPDEISKYLMSERKSLPSDMTALLPQGMQTYQPMKQMTDKQERTQKWEWEMPKSYYMAKPKEKLLKISPEKIVFTSYKRGCMYQQSVYVQNVGSNTACVQVVSFPEQSKFKLKWNEKIGGVIMIAAGLSIAIKVEFHCKSLNNANDILILKIEGGEDVLVPISAQRLAPVLEALEPVSSHDPTLWSIIEQSMETTLECGVTLVGESVFQMINMYNRGGDGHFWIMTEEEWTLCSIENATYNNVLKIPPFTITPYYFYLQQFEEITLCLLYEPKSQGLQIKQLKILCDNCVIHSLDVLADAIYFESRFISFASLKKTFAIEMDDDKFAEYFLNIGRILPNGCAQKSFFIANESDLEFHFHWKVRAIQIGETLLDSILLKLPTYCVTVTPSQGILAPNLEQHFLVKCAMQDSEPGQYRVILSLYIEKLPWQSVIRASNVRKAAVNPCNIDKVDVLLNEIELWIECVPLAVMLQPCVIKITSGKLRCNEEPIFPKLTLANTMLDDIAFHWMPISPPLSEPAAVNTIEMLVNFGSVNAKTFMPCPLKITALSQGLLLHEIRCSINEGERSVEMMVCAQVSEPQIHPSKYILNFGSIRKNTFASQQLKFFNESNSEVLWIAREFKYDFDAGILKQMSGCRLSVDSGFFSHPDSVCTVDYTLDTMNSGIWVSVVELGVVSFSRRYRQHFILVVGDILEPLLTLSAPPQFTAFLCPPSPLYLGIPVITNIILRNHSNVPATFKWGIPVGEDIHKLRFDIKPRSDVIQPADDMVLEVLIIPSKTGSVSSFFIPCFIEDVQEPVLMGIKCDVGGLNVTFTLPAEEDPECENFSVAYFPWSVDDKVVFPPETLTSQDQSHELPRYPSFNEINQMCESIQRYKNLKKHVVALHTQSEQITEKDVEEQILQKIDYETEVNFPLGQGDLKLSLGDEYESEPVIMDGKKGKLYSDEEYRLVLHFPLSDDSNPSQSYLFGRGYIKNEPDYDPYHTYPLVKDNDLISSSALDMIQEVRDSLLERTFGEHSQDHSSLDIGPKTSTIPASLAGSVIKDLLINVASDTEDRKSESFQKKINQKKKKINKDLMIKHNKPKIHVVQEIFLKNVKVKEVATTKFSIKNETPMSTHFEVKATNFPPNSCIEMQDIANSVFCEMSYKERDKLECCVLPGNGVVVFVKQHSKYMQPHEIIMIELSAYANTWGTYNEIIACYIHGLPPFYMKLTIEVEGSPVHFAMAPPHILSRCPVRFGTMHYGCKPRTRSLKIYNESCIKLTITWHIFIKDNPCKVKTSEMGQHFNVVVDVYTAMEGNNRDAQHRITEEELCDRCKVQDEATGFKSKKDEKMELNLVPYIGNEDYTLFEVYPKETIIESKGEEVIRVSFDPAIKNYLTSVSLVYALLVGFIKVAPEDTYSKGRFHRSYGKSLQPIWLSLSAEVEVPFLTLETDYDDLEFYIEAAHVLSHSNKECTISRIFLVKNNCKSPVTAFVDTEKPFLITEVDTMAHRHTMIKTDNKDDIAFTLLADECAEIHVSCVVKEEFILHVQETFWTATSKEYTRDQLDRFSKKSAIYECPLRIIQPNLMEQVIQMKVLIEFPLVTVSTDKVEFGTVCVGDTKWAVLEVENKTVTHVWFNITKVYQTNEFSLHPSCGVIPPASAQGCSILPIKVNFSPTEKMAYMDYLRIDTYIPGDERIVVVDGIGTPDSKFHMDF